MGTKISAMTTTGSAPSNSYLPLAYDGKNYKIQAGEMHGIAGVGGYIGTESAWSSSYLFAKIEIGDLGTAASINIAIATEFKAIGGNLNGQLITCIVQGTLFGIPFLDLGTTTTCFNGTIFGDYTDHTQAAGKQAQNMELAAGSSFTDEGGLFVCGGIATYRHYLVVEGTKLYLVMNQSHPVNATIWSKSVNGVTIVFSNSV